MALPTIMDNGLGTLLAGSISPTISNDYTIGRNGVPWLVKQKWDIDIRLSKDSGVGGAIGDQITALETMFSGPFRRLLLYDANGQLTKHSIAQDTALGGIRVMSGPSYVKVSRGELVTVRNATVTLEAVFPYGTKNASDVVDFDEQINQDPAGPTMGMVQPNVGPATMQTTRTQKFCTTVQSGTVTYYGMYGPLPQPVLPIQFMDGPVKVNLRHPQKIGSGSLAAYVGFSIDYTRTFLTSFNATVVPTKWNG